MKCTLKVAEKHPEDTASSGGGYFLPVLQVERRTSWFAGHFVGGRFTNTLVLLVPKGQHLPCHFAKLVLEMMMMMLFKTAESDGPGLLHAGHTEDNVALVSDMVGDLFQQSFLKTNGFAAADSLHQANPAISYQHV